MKRRCKGSWIDSYLEYTSTQESPRAFHKWVALSLISSAVGRHVWIPRVKYTIYPNLFVILVAGSAQCRKSVSIAIGLGLLRNVENPPMIFAQKVTTEALIQALEESKKGGECSGLIVSSELSVFMGADAIRSGIIPALTDLYDSPKEWVYHTRGRGKEILHNVTLGFLAASTRDWLKASIPADAVGGGFTSRIVFVYQKKPSRVALFESKLPNEDTLRMNLTRDLSHIANEIKGPVTFTPEAKEYALEWYTKAQKDTHDPKLDGYFGRKHDTMFKLATCLAVAENDTLIITISHIQHGLRILDENEPHLEEIINSVVASKHGEEIEKILKIVQRAGKIKHSDLIRKSWRIARAEDLQKMIDTLTMSGDITCDVATDGRTRLYRIGKQDKDEQK